MAQSVGCIRDSANQLRLRLGVGIWPFYRQRIFNNCNLCFQHHQQKNGRLANGREDTHLFFGHEIFSKAGVTGNSQPLEDKESQQGWKLTKVTKTSSSLIAETLVINTGEEHNKYSKNQIIWKT